MQNGDKKACLDVAGNCCEENTNLRKKTMYACIAKAHESKRKRLESTHPRNHEDHIAEKECNSRIYYNLEFENMFSLAVGENEQQESCYSDSSKREKESPLCYVEDICHLKNAELELKFQKYKGRVVLRGDVVNDDSGAYAVFTERGSSASQLTAATVMDVLAR